MNFQHEILFEVDTDTNTDIKILINDEIKWTNALDSKSHKFTATFQHKYDNAKKNIIKIKILLNYLIHQEIYNWIKIL